MASHLVWHIKNQPQTILDLGCGRGEILKNISWNFQKLIGVDFALNMCDLHPKSDKITILHDSFENPKLYKTLENYTPFDLVISSSALQWAKDKELILNEISKLTNNIAFSIFCNGTFKTIYEMTSLQNFLPQTSDIITLFSKYFSCISEVKTYQLHFEDNLSKFRYIKKSGVSGGERKLNYSDTKKLIHDYPLDYLEFEVLFIYSKF